MLINYIKNKKPNYQNIQNILSSSEEKNHFTNNGPAKIKLEKYLHSFLKIDSDKKVLCVSNGTLALHAINFYFKIKNNDNIRWLTPAYTFPSCVIGGMETRVLDINLDDYSLNKVEVEKQKNYDGIIITNLFGTYPDIGYWDKFCKDNNKILILDNASSPLSEYNNKNISNYGNFSFGSLHHTKIIGFGEGGFIVCPNEDYELLNSIVTFGFQGDRIYNKNSSNYKMSDVQAAFILDHLNNFNLQKHLSVQNIFLNEINFTGVKIFNKKDGVVYGNLPILFDKPVNNLIFKDLGIDAYKYYLPLNPLQNSSYLYERMVNFPLNENLQDEEIDIIIKAIKRQAKK
jgi:dTDP-4-amino-4,6-dideoxygalactose transaminase